MSGRTRTPTSGTAGNIQRSGSGLSENRSNRTAKTTTSYGADGSRITSTTSSYSASAQSGSSASQQQSQKNWQTNFKAELFEKNKNYFKNRKEAFEETMNDRIE